MRSQCTAKKSSPHSPQLEKARAQQRRPMQPINLFIKKKKLNNRGREGSGWSLLDEVTIELCPPKQEEGSARTGSGATSILGSRNSLCKDLEATLDSVSWTGLCLWASIWVGKERYLGSESLASFASEVALGSSVLDCQDKTESKGPPASGPAPSPFLPGADAPGQGHQSGAVVCRGSEG